MKGKDFYTYVSQVKYRDTLNENYLKAIKEKGLKSKEAQDCYVEIKMHGGMISLDWPPRITYGLPYDLRKIDDKAAP